MKKIMCADFEGGVRSGSLLSFAVSQINSTKDQQKKRSKTINPARERCYGDKLEVIAPGAAKSWMKVQPNETATEHGPTNEVTDQTDNSNTELSDSDDDQDS